MPQILKDHIQFLQNNVSGLTIPGTLQKLSALFPGGVTFSTSFSNEDQVITDFISKAESDISIFTLDTGRLFPETYYTWNRTLENYKIRIQAFYPDEQQLQIFVTDNGPDSFYSSVELRKACCGIRKIVPLGKALINQSVWITGIRAEHSQLRECHEIIEWDESNGIIKYNPLLKWTAADVLDYIHSWNVPENPLHSRGFASIGCAPCTRAIKAGEDFRAGRWWWEDDTKKECGLHVSTGNKQ